MSKLKQFFYPETLDEALKILGDESKKVGIVAGGSSVSLTRDGVHDALVDITRMGLDYIKDEKAAIVVGAATPIEDLYFSKPLQEYADGVISEAASLIASRPLRNVITLGGNITQVKIWSDMPVALLALDAKIKVAGKEERTMTAEEFFTEHPTKQLAQGDLVTEISFPKTTGKSVTDYIKFSKTLGDYAIATVCAHLEFNGETCTKARIVVGSVAQMPQRCKHAEVLLENQKIAGDMVDRAAKACQEHVDTLSNLWGSAEYKTEVVGNLVKRALENCLDKAQAKK